MNRTIPTHLGRLALVALLLAAPATAASAQAPAPPAGWSDAYAYANGIRIHYWRAAPAPGKPPMVMVHGVTDIGLSWTTLTEKLQDSYDIYMLDARGHGLTDPFTAADTSNTLVKDVVEFVQTMKLEKPILMGHSMGAATVMRVGAEYPELAKAIIMLDPGLGRGGPPRPAATGAAATGAAATGATRPASSGATGATAAAATAPAAATPRPASAPDRLSVSMTGTPETLVAQNNYKFEDLVATCRRATPKWALLDCQYWALSKKQYHGAYSSGTWQAMSGTMRTADALAKIKVPALVLKADASPEVRKANEEAAKVMQRGRLVHIDGAGHNLHHDQLARTVEVLKEFLATL
jgi:pimeloyl-ACP methyl ester carboxylesterase